VSGERPDVLVIEADSTGTVASFARTLDTLPREHRWVLVGGFAVNLRISTLHRLTADVDTLTSAHREFLELLVGRENVEQLAAAKVLVGSDPSVKVDVMASTVGEELANSHDGRAAHR
jgi:hypothetical protein